MRIESKDCTINNSAESIYNYISNFNNFTHLMPEQVENWKCDDNTCSFSIKGFFHLGLQIKEKIPFSSIIIAEDSETKSPFPFLMVWEFNPSQDLSTQVKVTLEVEINAMIAMMAKKPLQNLADLMVDKLKEVQER